MPIYEYKCGSCGEVFELIQRFSDEPLTVHEACGGPVHRLISPSAFQFKGSGWYVTDYAKGGAKPAPSSSTDGGKPDGGKSDGGKPDSGKSETKSEAPAKTETSSTTTSSDKKD